MPIKIYRRKKIWHYRGTIAGDKLRGTTGTEDRQIAQRIAAKIEADHHKRSLDGPREVLTFPQAVTLYEKAGKGGDYRSRMYIRKLEDFWKNARIKDMTAGAIRQSAIEIYPDASGATRNRQVITPTQAIINHAAELELCAPIRIKRFPVESKIKTPVRLEWIDAFVGNAEPCIGALALFMFSTGCRISEARSLLWSEINFQNRTILIRKTKTKRQRLPYMPQRLLVALANLPRDRAPFDYPETTLRRAWDATVERAGIERLTFHSCRHGFATALLHDGVDVVTIARLGGWDDASQVLKTYGHAKDDPRITEQLFGQDRKAHERHR